MTYTLRWRACYIWYFLWQDFSFKRKIKAICIFCFTTLPNLCKIVYCHFHKRVHVTMKCWSIGQPKVIFFYLFKSWWNVHKPNFTLIPWATTKLLGQKKSNFIVMSNFFSSKVFSRYRYLVKVTTTDFDIVLLKFWNCNGFVATSDVIMLFSPLPGDCIWSRLGMSMQETWSYSTKFGKCSIHY